MGWLGGCDLKKETKGITNNYLPSVKFFELSRFKIKIYSLKTAWSNISSATYWCWSGHKQFVFLAFIYMNSIYTRFFDRTVTPLMFFVLLPWFKIYKDRMGGFLNNYVFELLWLAATKVLHLQSFLV